MKQAQLRFAKTFHEMMGNCDLDDVNCMETLDRKISATDEELVIISNSRIEQTYISLSSLLLFLKEENDKISEWASRHSNNLDKGIVSSNRKALTNRAGKRLSGIEIDDKLLNDKNYQRNYRKSCDLSLYQVRNNRKSCFFHFHLIKRLSLNDEHTKNKYLFVLRCRHLKASKFSAFDMIHMGTM